MTKKRYYRKKKKTSLAKRVRRLEIKTKPEFKWLDTIAANADCWTTPTVVPLTNITQGDDDYQRVGDHVRVRSVQINWKMSLIMTSNSTAMGRMCLVMEKDPQGSAPTWSQIFDNSGSNTPLDLRLITNAKNYKILWNKVVVVSNPDGANTSTQARAGSFYKKLNIPVELSGAAAQSNGLFLCFMSDTGQTYGDLSYKCRIRFTDV